MTQITPIDNEYTVDPSDNERYIIVKISNKAIRRIKSAITEHEGDDDDLNNAQIMKEIREDIHEIWKILNPS